MTADDIATIAIFGGFVLLIALLRWLLARMDGFTFWTNRPLIGWAAYNARHDAAVQAAKAEEEHAAASLEALTVTDIEWLQWWGWEVPQALQDRVEAHREAELARRRDEKAAALEVRLKYGFRLTQAELAAVADGRIRRREVVPLAVCPPSLPLGTEIIGGQPHDVWASGGHIYATPQVVDRHVYEIEAAEHAEPVARFEQLVTSDGRVHLRRV